MTPTARLTQAAENYRERHTLDCALVLDTNTDVDGLHACDCGAEQHRSGVAALLHAAAALKTAYEMIPTEPRTKGRAASGVVVAACSLSEVVLAGSETGGGAENKSGAEDTVSSLRAAAY